MTIRNTLAATAACFAMLVAGGCAVTRDQTSVGGYVDDTTITAKVKSKFIEDKTVGASSIQVETLNGTVQLAGFAKSDAERTRAASLAREVNGVKSVKNDIIVRP